MNVLWKKAKKSFVNPLQERKKAVLLPSQLRLKADNTAERERLESFLKKKFLKELQD
jgi:hypothetical protein